MSEDETQSMINFETSTTSAEAAEAAKTRTEKAEKQKKARQWIKVSRGLPHLKSSGF